MAPGVGPSDRPLLWLSPQVGHTGPVCPKHLGISAEAPRMLWFVLLPRVRILLTALGPASVTLPPESPPTLGQSFPSSFIPPYFL